MVKKESQEKKKKSEKFFYGVGRRKSAVAQVRLYSKEGAGEIDMIINEENLKKYFPTLSLQNTFFAPLKAVGLQNKFKVSAMVKGGGANGQVEAIRLGISRALVKFDENFKSILKANGFLTRDARKVERKKPGLRKARRAPQWSKR